MAKKKVDSIRHKEKRTNIPTEELRDFVAEDERTPKTMLYPRDPSLDPQLVWKGKDEQDRQDLAVPVVPIYIQEKIHPNALVSDILKQSEERNEKQLDFFGDFNGLNGDFDKKVDFYSHQDDRKPHWSNRMILGDSLLVMASLAEKEGLKGKIQTIYFDPPYGIEFKSNWQVSTRNREVQDGKAEHATREPEQVRAFRDTWKLGIHSYLAYLRDRLRVAHELLTDTGSVFLQIGEQNVHLVRCVLDEIFGAPNSIVTFLVKKKGSQKSNLVAPVNDYILWYPKSRPDIAHDPGVKFRPLLESWGLDSDTVAEFRYVELADGREFSVSATPDPSGEVKDYRLTPKQLFIDHPGSRLFRANPLTSGGERKNQSLPFTFNGKTFEPPRGSCWKHTARLTEGELCGMERLGLAGRLIASTGTWRFKSYLDDYGHKPMSNWWDGFGGASDPIYVVQTNADIVQRCILMTTDPGDIVLDPTCGSGTTAYVAELWGRRWITIDTSRVAIALARTRLMASRYPYHLLADTPEGVRKEAELTGKMAPPHQSEGDIRKGFVYKRVPHITSSSFANNPDIREGMSKAEVQKLILRSTESEPLYDQPYEDTGRIRVTGPFTVESLSPYRVLSTDVEQPGTEVDAAKEQAADFATMIIENLRKAGVQNTVKQERLKFDSLDPFAGTWIHASGSYTESDGTNKRVAVSIGPEHGTVGPGQLKEAAKEAVKGLGYDILIICGFAFDPHVTEEAKRYGQLTVLIARMNPDLSMGDELLKKTGAGNLFMVFGEPDIDIKKLKDGDLIVAVKGVDVYDPTTGQIRNSSTEDIACWFLDSDYDGESFFVRHAYFTGANEPYEKLKRALRAEVDEAAWASLYSTTSRPFPSPKHGRLAIKVINHYGDEVLKVIPV